MSEFKTKFALLSVVAAALFVVPVLVPIAGDLVGQTSTTKGSSITIGDNLSKNLRKYGNTWNPVKGGYKESHMSFTPKRTARRRYNYRTRKRTTTYVNERGYAYWDWKKGVPVTANNQKFELYVTWPNNKGLSKTISAYVLHKNSRNRWDYLVKNVIFSQASAPSDLDYGGVKWKKIGSTFVLNPNKQTRVYLLAPSGQKMTVDAVMLRPLKPVADCGNKKREGDEQCDLGPEKPDDGCHKCRYKCYDSDGDDKEGAGYILVINKNGEIKKQPDSCDGDQVVEGLCSGNKPISDVEDCKYGCENGACVEIEIGKIIHKIGPLQGKKVGPYAAFGISNIKNISSDSEVEILAKQKFYIDNNGITQNTSGDVYVTVPMEKKPMKDEPNYKWSGKRKFTEDESGTYNYKVLIKNSKGELLDEVASEHAFSIVGETPCAKKGEVVYGDSVPGPKLCCDDLKIRPWGCEVPKNGSEGVCVEKLTCGNDTCDEGEDECNCEEDCGSCEEDEDCASGKTCYKDECVPWGDVCPTLGEYQCSESKESDCDGIWFDDYGPKGLDCCCSGELCPVVQGDDDDDEGDDDDDNECVEQGSNSNLPRCKECLGEMCEEYKNQKDGADKSMEECKEHCIDVYPPYVSCVDQHKQSDNPKCKDCLREVCGSLVNDDDMSKKALDQCKDHCLDN